MVSTCWLFTQVEGAEIVSQGISVHGVLAVRVARVPLSRQAVLQEPGHVGTRAR